MDNVVGSPPAQLNTTERDRASGWTEQITLASVAAAILRHRRILVIGVVTGFVFFVGVRALTRQNVAYSRFVPSRSRSSNLPLSGLAAQFGLGSALSGLTGGESVDFYAELLLSREVLVDLAKHSFRFSTGGSKNQVREGTLIDLLELDGTDSAKLFQRAVKDLQRRISVDINYDAGTVSIATRAPWPELAEQMNAQLIALLDEFNNAKRQSRAANERKFIESRILEAATDLDKAENELQSFMEQNRDYSQSPQLRFQAAKLQRRIDLAQQVFMSLAQSLEEARIEEVRDTPTISVVDHPEGSARPEGRLASAGILGILVGLTGSLVVVLLSEYVMVERARFPGSYQELATMWRQVAPRGRRRRANPN